ncbi:MAG: cytochrome d ubiquinol oxidase subunit II [Candidatus Omnitrophica bacterium]|nr:cytochrome d ubiquinol oxidase subunit II [Candidatus Omnitrophota bacterium]
MDLNTLWFLLVGILMTGYAVLDGFDLGVGALHLFTKSDRNRRILLNSIGPVWDGNEVWLVTGGGALFAAFPDVYATVFSGFYMAFMLLLFCLIFRAVAIEFRSKQPMKWWKDVWDFSFSVSSILSSLIIGIALGNLAWGIPLGPDKEFTGNFFTLIHPYSLLIGVLVLSLFMMHGAIYGVLKTEGELQRQIKGWIKSTMIFFMVTYALATVATLLYAPQMSDVLKRSPVFFMVPLFNILAIANIPREISKGNDFKAFLSSCLAMVTLMALFGIDMYPNLVYSRPFSEFSLTIYNSASSQKTLQIMGLIALLGMPLVMAYTVSIYWIFRGKVKLEESSY